MNTLQQLIEDQKELIEKITPLLPGTHFICENGNTLFVRSVTCDYDVICDVYKPKENTYLVSDTINILYLLFHCTISKGSHNAATN